MAACASEKGDQIIKALTQLCDDGRIGYACGNSDGFFDAPKNLEAVPVEQDFIELRSGIKASLNGKLERLLMANADVERDFYRSGTRLAGKKLATIKSGNLDVFERSEIGEDIDTEISILVDGSGSMRKLWTPTLASAFALADVLSVYHVDFSIYQFSRHIQLVHAANKRWSKFHDEVPCMMGGGTSTAEALNWGASQLVDSRANRKILVVITDGEPNSAVQALAVANDAQQAGMELIHILIGSAGVNYEVNLRTNQIGFVSRCGMNGSANDLAIAMEQALTQAFQKTMAN
jgi:hypothetical protein